MGDFYEEYLQAKLCLFKMVGQFYSSSISVGMIKARGNNIPVDCMDDNDYILVCFHDYDSEGLNAWELLGIDKDFIPLKELWDMEYNLKKEVKDNSVNYYELYLRISILLIDMVNKYYSDSISFEEAKAKHVRYDEDEDELYDEVEVCYNLSQSAGESAWNLFGIEDSIVGKSVFNNKRKELTNQLLSISKRRVKTNN